MTDITFEEKFETVLRKFITSETGRNVTTVITYDTETITDGEFETCYRTIVEVIYKYRENSDEHIRSSTYHYNGNFGELIHALSEFDTTDASN